MSMDRGVLLGLQDEIADTRRRRDILAEERRRYEEQMVEDRRQQENRHVAQVIADRARLAQEEAQGLEAEPGSLSAVRQGMKFKPAKFSDSAKVLEETRKAREPKTGVQSEPTTGMAQGGAAPMNEWDLLRRLKQRGHDAVRAKQTPDGAIIYTRPDGQERIVAYGDAYDVLTGPEMGPKTYRDVLAGEREKRAADKAKAAAEGKKLTVSDYKKILDVSVSDEREAWSAYSDAKKITSGVSPQEIEDLRVDWQYKKDMANEARKAFDDALKIERNVPAPEKKPVGVEAPKDERNWLQRGLGLFQREPPSPERPDLTYQGNKKALQDYLTTYEPMIPKVARQGLESDNPDDQMRKQILDQKWASTGRPANEAPHMKAMTLRARDVLANKDRHPPEKVAESKAIVKADDKANQEKAKQTMNPEVKMQRINSEGQIETAMIPSDKINDAKAWGFSVVR